MNEYVTKKQLYDVVLELAKNIDKNFLLTKEFCEKLLSESQHFESDVKGSINDIDNRISIILSMIGNIK